MNRRKQNNPLFLLPFLIGLAAMLGMWFFTKSGMTQALAMQTATVRRDFVTDRVEFATAALKKGDTAGADKAVSDAVRLLEADSAAYVTVAESLLRSDQPVYAASMLARASEKPEIATDPMIWSTLAKAQKMAGNKEESLPAAQEADRRAAAILAEVGKGSPVSGERPDPAVNTAILRLMQAANYYQQTLVPAKAIAAAREAHRLFPNSPLTENEYGYLLADCGSTRADFDEAVVLTKRAADAVPDSGIVRDSYGWALYKVGDLIGAQRALREAADLEPDVAEIRYHLGIVYAKRGLTREATIELNRALALNPDLAEAKAALGNRAEGSQKSGDKSQNSREDLTQR